MGRAHGEVLRQTQAFDGLHFYSDFLRNSLFFHMQSRSEKALSRVLYKYLSETLEKEFRNQIPWNYREAILGLAEGSGKGREVFEKAFVMPDVFSYLLARSFQLKKIFPRGLGCSSFVFRQKGTAGKLFHARNLDFPGGETWYGKPTLLLFDPPNGQRFLSVTGLGIHTAGITATNEAGITLSLNQNYSIAVGSKEATPVVVWGHEMMKRARSLEDALRIARSIPLGAGWNLLLSSSRERDAIVIEANAKELAFRRIEGKGLVTTNSYNTSLSDSEYWLSDALREDSKRRQNKLLELLRPLVEKEDEVEAQDLYAILGSACEVKKETETGYGFTPCQLHTVSSVVFEPRESRLHLAVGGAPISRQDRIVFAWDDGLRSLRKVPFERNQADRAREAYSLAAEAYFPHEDLERCETYLRKAREEDPRESLYAYVLGWILLKKEKTDQALELFKEAQEGPSSDVLVHLIQLAHAKTLDLLGRREEAKRIYGHCLDAPFSYSIRNYLRRSFTFKMARRAFIDFRNGDVTDV